MRVLIYVHGHPNLKPGGSEVAAYALYRALGREAGIESFFLACAPDEQFSGQLALHQLDDRGREFMLPSLISNYFFFVGGERNRITGQIIELIERLEIEVFHLHHFLGLGLDTILQIRHRFPLLRMVFTAHEYLSICARDGQMIRSGGNQLCHAAVPLNCSLCVPHWQPLDFEVRREWFRNFFDCFQAVVSPSAFLAQRLIAWGLPAGKVSVVENLHPHSPHFRREAVPATNDVRRFGFFAQINEYKGTSVLLDAAELLQARQAGVEIHLFGAITAEPAFQEAVRQRLATKPDCVHYHGGYLPDGILDLMKTVDWVVIPSIWWENSPTVIEEALIAGRPLLASDIGGMREKVQDGVDGLHFPVGDAAALAELIERVAGDRALWQRLAASRRAVPTGKEVVAKHLALYRRQDPAAAQAVA